jgi:hypothetical protein
MDAHELLLSPIAYMAPPRVLSGLSSAEAGVRVSGAPHSVVEIVAHMVYWQSWFLERCAGVGTPPASSASLGGPDISAGEWEGRPPRAVTPGETHVRLCPVNPVLP